MKTENHPPRTAQLTQAMTMPRMLCIRLPRVLGGSSAILPYKWYKWVLALIYSTDFNGRVVLEDLLEERTPTAIPQPCSLCHWNGEEMWRIMNAVICNWSQSCGLNFPSSHSPCQALGLSNGFDRAPCCCYTWCDAQTTKLHPRGCGPRAASLRGCRSCPKLQTTEGIQRG